MRISESRSACSRVADGSVRIDNNVAPVAFLDEVNLVANPDQRRGIAVAFTVLDEESDPVRVVLQWRREEQVDFPVLPGTVAELVDLLENPARDADRKLAQIGQRLRRSEGAIKVMVCRARAALRRCLDGEPAGPSDDE